jgi:SecY interacting protein Syd
MSEVVTQALDKFMQKYQIAAKLEPSLLMTEYDPKWPSACYLSSDTNNDNLVEWRPVKRELAGHLDGLVTALDMQIHPDIVTFYSTYWSNNLNAKTAKGNLQLLQAWNQDDFERLQQNLIGHILMKRRLKQPETLFFALTDEDDFIITLDNQSGEVLLEQVGLLPKEVLAANLAAFIDSIEPSVISVL